MDEATLDIILIQQKDRLLVLIDRARSLAECESVAETLLTLRTLWIASSYEYKFLEVQKRLLAKVDRLKDSIDRNLSNRNKGIA